MNLFCQLFPVKMHCYGQNIPLLFLYHILILLKVSVIQWMVYNHFTYSLISFFLWQHDDTKNRHYGGEINPSTSLNWINNNINLRTENVVQVDMRCKIKRRRIIIDYVMVASEKWRINKLKILLVNDDTEIEKFELFISIYVSFNMRSWIFTIITWKL